MASKRGNEWVDDWRCLCRLLKYIVYIYMCNILSNERLDCCKCKKKIYEICKWNVKLSPWARLVQWNLWIRSLGVNTCMTSRRHRLTSIRLFCRSSLVPVTVSVKLSSFHLLMAVTTCHEFHWNPFITVLIAKQKKYIWHWTDRCRYRQGRHIMPPMHHSLQRHNSSLLVCVSWAIPVQPWNSVLIRRV